MNVALDHSQDLPSAEALERHISRATKALLAEQRKDGHWCFELEADATIPAEYVLLRHFRGEAPDLELERLIAVYLRRVQGDHGGWPLVHAGPFDISASVKAYFALKMIGDDVDAPHMRRAREAILAHGGAARGNVFTRFLLALYGEIPWSGVPTMPVEIMLLPRWFPFHLDKISYWARTVLVPLLVLQALKPKPANPRRVRVQELFVAPPETVRDWPTGAHQAWLGVKIFGAIDWLLKRVEPAFPTGLRRRAIDKAAAFVTERLNGEDGLGAIYPAMANAVLMYDALGLPGRPPPSRRGAPVDREAARRQAGRGLLPALPVAGLGHGACDPYSDGSRRRGERRRGAGGARLARAAAGARRQGRLGRPSAQTSALAGGRSSTQTRTIPISTTPPSSQWPWTGPIAAASPAPRTPMRRESRAPANGSRDLQSRDGDWAAFDADNTHSYLNHIPFADHGALLDPPTADVTARCVSLLAQTRRDDRDEPDAGSRRRGARQRSGEGRELVRPLGDELHLWDMVGALRPRHRGPGPAIRADAPRRRLARRDPEC